MARLAGRLGGMGLGSGGASGSGTAPLRSQPPEAAPKAAAVGGVAARGGRAAARKPASKYVEVSDRCVALVVCTTAASSTIACWAAGVCAL